MKRSATMVAALIASAGLALAGCGGDKGKGGDKKAPDKKGAAAEGEKKGTTTANEIKFKCAHEKCTKTKMATAASPPS